MGVLRLFHNDVLTQNKQQAEHESAPFSSTYLTLAFWFFSSGFLGLNIKGFFFFFWCTGVNEIQEATFSRRHNGVERILDCCACADACKHAHQKQATNPRLPDALSTWTETCYRQRTGVNHLVQPIGSSQADAACWTHTLPCEQQPYSRKKNKI